MVTSLKGAARRFGGTLVRRLAVVHGPAVFVAAIALLILLDGTAADAAEHRFAVLLDTDLSSSTGCAIATAKGTVAGIDEVWTTVVTTTASGVTVTRIERQSCSSGSLSSPVVAAGAGWPVTPGTGLSGTGAIETFIPLSALPGGGTIKLQLASTSATGGSDATSSFLVALAATAGGSSAAREIPLSPWTTTLLAVALALAAAWALRARPRHGGAVLLVLLVVSGLVLAGTVVLDGSIGDWAGMAPRVTNADTSGPLDARIAAVFVQQDNANLYLRIDADVRADAGANAPPTVSAGADQSIAVNASASLGGTATDDGLPNPPGALTIAWSTVSGPGTVTFANAAVAGTSATFSATGVYVLRLTASDGALAVSDDVQVTVTPSANTAPVTHADSTSTVTGTPVSINVLANDTDADGDALTVSAFTQGANGSVSCASAGLCSYTPNAGFDGSDSFTYTASDGHGGQTVGNVAIAVGSGEIAPSTVNPAVATTVGSSTQFLYSGSNAVQTGVAPGTIEVRRAAVVRGRVIRRDGTPLAGVIVKAFGHPEFGQTASRSDGEYDMAVNGGGLLTLDYAARGFVAAQRQTNVPWQDYVTLPDVVLQPLDAASSTITSLAPAMQVHRGGVSTDADGSRRATLLFPAGTSASMLMPDGSSVPLASLTLRATELTVGPNGKKAMPAPLPPSSAYTYAVSFSVDEAIAAGAKSVVFNQPILQYVENFLSFPVGTPVPTGVYDPLKTAWLPIDDGRVIKILGVSAGLANVDSDGDGAADNALGMSDDERRTLATLYVPGQTLWRTPLPHLSVVDNNWSFIPAGASPPTEAGPVNDDPLQDPQMCTGCMIEMDNGVLGERVPIVGTSFSLNYRSDRVPGHVLARTIELSGDTLPPNVQSIGVNVSVAGRSFEQSFAPAPNQRFKFVWDGKDAYGRTLQGGQTITGSVDYHYPATYVVVAGGGGGAPSQSFARPPANGAQLLEGFRDGTYATSLPFTANIGEGLTDARALGLGGWTLSVHHFFDPIARVVHMGDGTRRRADSLSRVINTALSGPKPGQAGALTGTSFVVAPDGSLYFGRSDGRGSFTIQRLAPDGTETQIACGGSGVTPPFGDDGPAASASFCGPPLALGPDGSIYLQSENVIRRIGPDGIIRAAAGRYPPNFGTNCQGTLVPPPDNVPATLTDLCDPVAIAVAPDETLYIAEATPGGFGSSKFERIRRVGPDGVISTFAGSVACDNFFDLAGCDAGAQAADHHFGFLTALAVATDGTVYAADEDRIKRIGGDGKVQTFATGIRCSNFIGSSSIVLAPDGSIYGTNPCGQVLRAAPDGTVTAVAGKLHSPNSGTGLRSGDGGPALAADIGSVDRVGLAPDGTLLLTSFGSAVAPDGTRIPDSVATTIRRIGVSLPGVSTAQFSVASPDGTELYVFDASGVHLRTLDTLTGAALYTFAYDAHGALAQVTQTTGGTDNVTTIERDGNGNPTAIVGPYGQRTLLALDGNGFLASIANPASETVRLTYGTDGLMTAYTDARGKTRHYSYDADGRLQHEADPAGGTWDLARTLTPPGKVVVDATTALSRTSHFTFENLPGNVRQRTITAPDGTTNGIVDTFDAGDTTFTAADGSVTALHRGTDPQFFMQTPIAQTFSMTFPSTLAVAGAGTRTAVLANATDPLSLVSLTDTSTLDARTTTTSYVAATRTFTITTPAGRTSTITLDALGRQASSQPDGLAPWSLSYDARGRVASVTRGSGVLARTVTFAYNSDGFLQSITDPIGRTAQFAYDAAGRMTGKTLPDGTAIALGYDAAGNLTSIAPPGRAAHTLAYSGRNELTSVTPPAVAGTGPTTFAYDADGMPTVRTRPDGRTVTFAYDGGGHLVSRKLANAGVTTSTDALAYDAAGRLATFSASSGETVAFTYDGPLETGRTWSGPVAGSVNRTFDTGLRVSSESVDGANNVAFAYDDDNLLVGAGSLSIARDAQSGLISGTVLATVSSATGYNVFGEATSYSVTHGGASLVSWAFERDALGRITRKVETIGGATATFDYGYDLAGQLVTVSKDGATVESYGYDANGNRTTASVAGSAATATYDAQDRLVQYGGTTFAYNPAGDLVSKAGGGQTTTYQYDALGNLLSVTLPSGHTVAYVVDGANRRVGRKLDGTLVGGFLYDAHDRVVAELDGSGAVASRFVYATANVLAYMVKGGSTFRMVTDPIGSVRLVVDAATGAIAQRIDYDAFGNVAADTNPGFQPFGFAGGLYDPGTGLVRFGARDYDASVGRWTAKNPIGFRGRDANLYRYVHNDPVNTLDRSGRPDELAEKMAYLREVIRNTEEALKEGSNEWGNRLARRDLYQWAKRELEALRRADAARNGGGFGRVNCGGYLSEFLSVLQFADFIDPALESFQMDENFFDVIDSRAAKERDEQRQRGVKTTVGFFLGVPVVTDLDGGMM